MFRKFWSVTVLLLSLIYCNELFSYGFSCEHNSIESPFLLSKDQLKEKLSNPVDTQKIIDILLKTSSNRLELSLIELVIGLTREPFSNFGIEYIDFWDKTGVPISLEQLDGTLSLLLNNFEIIKAIERYCIRHVDDASYPYQGFIDERLLIHVTFKQLLIECILKKNLLKDAYHFDLFKLINFFKTTNDNDSLNIIFTTIEKNIDNIDTKILKTLAKDSLSTAHILAACTKLFEQEMNHTLDGTVRSFSEAIIHKAPAIAKINWARKKLAHHGLIKFAQNLTQTEAHFWINNHHIFKAFKDELEGKPAIVSLLDQILEHERQLSGQGKYVFYHAQRWHLYFLEDLYTRLWELTYKTKAPNYLFTRFLKDIPDPALLQQELKEASEICTALLSQGRSFGHRGDLLFLNYSLFGNTTNRGSCTISYFLSNDNIRSTSDLNAQMIFHALNLTNIYTDHAQQLQQLETTFNRLSSCGNLLQIAVTPDALKKCLYVAQPGGYKRTVHIEGIGDTDDIALIIDTLRTAPHKIKKSDVIEFCLILTRNLALQPGNGIEVYSFNPVEPDAWKAYEAQRDALLAQMASQIA